MIQLFQVTQLNEVIHVFLGESGDTGYSCYPDEYGIECQ